MTDKEIKTGHCKLNNVPSFIRKINTISETKTIVCFFYGRDHRCERLEDFKNRFKYEAV